MAARGVKEEDLIEGVVISSAPTLVHDAGSGILSI
jgi:predicted peroxiredoxin